jgi:hypothetical protein
MIYLLEGMLGPIKVVYPCHFLIEVPEARKVSGHIYVC